VIIGRHFPHGLFDRIATTVTCGKGEGKNGSEKQTAHNQPLGV